MRDQLLEADVGVLFDVVVDELDQRVQLLKALVLMNWISDEGFSAVFRRPMVQELQIVEDLLYVFSVVAINAIERLLLAEIQVLGVDGLFIRLVYLDEKRFEVRLDIDVVPDLLLIDSGA